MRYFLSLIALSLFSMSPAAKAAEDPSLDTLFGFTNQPPQSGDQPQKEQPAPAPESAPAAAPMAASPSKQNTLPQPEPLFGAAPEKPEPTAPMVQTPEPKPVAPVRILPSQVTTPEAPKPDTAPQKPVVAEPTIMTPAVEMPSKAEVTPPKAPEMPKPAPALAPTPVHEDKTVKQPAVPVVTPEPIKAEAPAPSVVKEEVVKPKTKVKAKAKTKPKGTVSKRHSKKKIQKKSPPKLVMSDEARRQKTRQMLEKSYDSLSMALRIDFPAFSSALPRQSKVDLQDRVAALRPEEIVVLYGSASIGPKGTPNAARAVAQSRMDRVTAFMESLGVRSDRVVTIDRSFTRQDSVDMAFVTVKTKRDANP
ncbi:MAG: hypothetical protein ACK5O4_01255 [bacterium]